MDHSTLILLVLSRLSGSIIRASRAKSVPGARRWTQSPPLQLT